MSNDVDSNQFQNQLIPHISDPFAVVFYKLDTHRVSGLCQLLCLWHRCKLLAFAHTKLSPSIQSICRCDDPMMHLLNRKWNGWKVIKVFFNLFLTYFSVKFRISKHALTQTKLNF